MKIRTFLRTGPAIVLLAFVLVVSCGGKKNTTASNDKPVLHIAGWLAGPVDNEKGPILDYFEKETGLRVYSENIDGQQYNDLINLRLSAGDIPDLFSLPNHATFAKFYDQGIVKEFPVSELQAKSKEFYDLYMSEAPSALETGKLDPKRPNILMAIPQYKFHAQFIFPYVWRKDWLQKVGINKIPDNLDELERAVYAFTNNDPDNNGRKDTYGISRSGLTAVYGAYGSGSDVWIKKGDGIVYGAVQPEMKQALAKLAQWYKDGVIDPEFVTGENLGGRGDLTQAFIINRIGLSVHGDYWTWCPVMPYGLNFQEFEKVHENPLDKLAFSPPILANDGKSRNTTRANLVQGTFWCFKNDIKDELFDKTLEFLAWEYGKYENYRTSWYGLEGDHWAFDENGYEQPVGDYLLDKGLQNKIGAYTTMGAIIEPFDYQARVRGGLASWARESGFADPTFTKFGFVNELTVVTPSYNDYWTELQKMKDEVYINIITGVQSVDSFDDFVRRWHSQGGQNITNEANEWYRGK
jgi:putative aldouronate transport system substrate-binding protein